MEDLKYYKSNKAKIVEGSAKETSIYLKDRINCYRIIIIKEGEGFILEDFANSLKNSLEEIIEDSNVHLVVVQASKNENSKTIECLINSLKRADYKSFPIVYGFDPGNEKISGSFVINVSKLLNYPT